MVDALVLLVAFAIVFGYVAWRTFRAPLVASTSPIEWLPDDLAHATIAYSEETLRSRKLGLVAQVDQIYRTAIGELVPVEIKHRRVVRHSDIIQLSVQAAVLGQHRNARVARYGYVRLTASTDHNRRPRYAAVELLGPEALERLRKRYLALRRGADPAGPVVRHLCGTCAYAALCPIRQREPQHAHVGAPQ